LANIALSIIGAILAATGGFISGIGTGINYAVMQIVSALTSYVDNIPVYGPLLSSEIQSNVQTQLSNDLSGYYLLGALLFIPGIVLAVYGGKEKTTSVPATMSAIRYCTKCGNRIDSADRFCRVCGQAVS
jgi:hypothetical protein